MEGGVAALCVSSGQAASMLSIQNLVKAGRQYCKFNRFIWWNMEFIC
jgi:O-acetylhomoserine/O-acetylserine sulfhydrylase-like pyridoxal-dependent enzyme